MKGVTGLEALHLQLAMIARPGELIEIRQLRPARQHFVPADRLPEVAAVVIGLGRRSDVYVGAAPRMTRDGSKRGVHHAHALWVDCDAPGSADRLRAFEPAPTFLLRSGRDGGLHGWWALREPVSAPGELERALRRLAHHLGADMACCDSARIMRAAGTCNHKHGEPRAVEVERLELDVFTVAEIVGALPDPPGRSLTVRPTNHEDEAANDPLHAKVKPATYVQALTGLTPNREGKIPCPLHEDRTPSFQVYSERGWFCFGCDRGGRIYDLAALLAGYPLPLRGADFLAVRAVLLRHFATELAS